MALHTFQHYWRYRGTSRSFCTPTSNSHAALAEAQQLLPDPLLLHDTMRTL